MLEKGQKPWVILSCGGTGGHLVPGLITGKALQQTLGWSVTYLVNDKLIGQQFLSRFGDQKQTLPEIQFNWLKQGRFFLFLQRFFQIWKQLKNLSSKGKPALLLSAGGASGVLPVLYFRLRGVPCVLLEQNRRMGRANRFLLALASRAYLTFPCDNLKPMDKLKVTGNPVRIDPDIKKLDKSTAAKILGLSPDVFTLLLIGGSQGAAGINQLAGTFVPLAKKCFKELQVIHITGQAGLAECRKVYDAMGLPHYTEAFTDQMEAVYSLANFAWSRAGGGVVAELAMYGIPTCFVPYPFAADRHQTANAEYAQDKGMGWIVFEKQLEDHAALKTILAKMENTETLEQCREKALAFAKPGAARDIVLELQHLLEEDRHA